MGNRTTVFYTSACLTTQGQTPPRRGWGRLRQSTEHWQLLLMLTVPPYRPMTTARESLEEAPNPTIAREMQENVLRSREAAQKASQAAQVCLPFAHLYTN